MSYSPVGDLVELAVPKSLLGGSEEMRVILFSLPSGTPSPAQDSAPSDPATFTTLAEGAENGNRLSKFAHATCAPKSCIRAAGLWDSALCASAGGDLTVVAFVDMAVTDVVSLEVLFNDTPTGLLLNDDGVEGDSQADDGVFTFSAHIGPNILPSGDHLLSIVATDSIGGCIGQWPSIVFSGCDHLNTPLQAQIGAGTDGLIPSLGRSLCKAVPAGTGSCEILAGRISNTEAIMGTLTVEAVAYINPTWRPDSVRVQYAGQPLDVELSDDGMGSDIVAGDGLFSCSFEVSREILEHRSYLLSLVAFKDGQPCGTWPYLRVEP